VWVRTVCGVRCFGREIAVHMHIANAVHCKLTMLMLQQHCCKHCEHRWNCVHCVLTLFTFNITSTVNIALLSAGEMLAASAWWYVHPRLPLAVRHSGVP
jgi:hypothetical protein